MVSVPVPVYACIFATKTITALDSAKDSKKLNEILKTLQQKGARIKDIKVSVGGERNSAHAVYLIIYESEEPLC